MSLPKSAVRKASRIYFDPAAGPAANAWWYECQRSHKKRGTAATRSDIDRELHKHDEEFHFGASASAAPDVDITIGEASEKMLHGLRLAIEVGKRRIGTLRQREHEIKIVLNVLGANHKLIACKKARMQWYIQQRLSGRGLAAGKVSRSGGAHIIKELKCIKALATAEQIALAWVPSDFDDDIRPVVREKLWIEPADLVLFLHTLRALRDSHAEETAKAFETRHQLVRRVVDLGHSLRDAAKQAGLSERASWNWVQRFKRHGAAGLESNATCDSKTSRVAFAYVLLKASTLMRDVELRDLRVSQVNTELKLIPYLNRSKRKERGTVAVIDNVVLDALRPLLKDKHPNAHVFDINGRPLAATTLCKIVARAWKTAFYDATEKRWKYPPQKHLSWVRHNVITEAIDSLGLQGAATFANHTEAKVTQNHYNLDRAQLRAKMKGLAAVRERFAL